MTLNKNIVANIIDQIEDFLEEKGVDIPNPEKAENGAEDTIIYGSDYDRLNNDIISTMENYGIHILDTYVEEPEIAEEIDR